MTTANRTILLVEDNEDDVFLMQRALKGAEVTNPLSIVEDGQQALDYLGGAGKYADRATYPLPAVVFLGKVRGPTLLLHLLGELAWAVLFIVMARVLYRMGLRRYSAFGG